MPKYPSIVIAPQLYPKCLFSAPCTHITVSLSSGCPRTASWLSLPSPLAAAPSQRWPTSSTGMVSMASTCPWPPWTPPASITPWATPLTPTSQGRQTGSSGVRGQPSPEPSWTSWSPCSRRRGTRTSSCGRRSRSRSICQNPEFR